MKTSLRNSALALTFTAAFALEGHICRAWALLELLGDMLEARQGRREKEETQ